MKSNYCTVSIKSAEISGVIRVDKELLEYLG